MITFTHLSYVNSTVNLEPRPQIGAIASKGLHQAMESAGQVSRWIEDEQSDEYSYVLQGKTETFTLVLAWEMKPGADPNDPDMPAYITLDKIVSST